MLVEVLAAAAATIAAVAVSNILESLWGAPSSTQSLPLSLTAEMSNHDQEMADRTRSLIQECYCRDGNNVMDSIRQMNAEERLDATRSFCARLAQLNGLQIDSISFYQNNNIGDCGSYNSRMNAVQFNIVELMWNGNDEAFEARITNFIDTIVHEYRHAVQFRAIREKGFWQIDDQRRKNWADNLPPNYINPKVDPRGYRMQPLESDAFTYAALVMRGVR